MKIQSGTLAPGILFAGIVAGPLYLLIVLLMTYLASPGVPLPVNSVPFMAAIIFLIPSTITGAIVGLPVNALGAGMMMKLGEVADCTCSRLVWAIVGGLIGLIAGLLLDLTSVPEAFLALVLTSALCAWICAKNVVWLDEDGEEMPDHN